MDQCSAQYETQLTTAPCSRADLQRCFPDHLCSALTWSAVLGSVSRPSSISHLHGHFEGDSTAFISIAQTGTCISLIFGTFHAHFPTLCQFLASISPTCLHLCFLQYLWFCRGPACRTRSRRCCRKGCGTPPGSCSGAGSWRWGWSCCRRWSCWSAWATGNCGCCSMARWLWPGSAHSSPEAPCYWLSVERECR